MTRHNLELIFPDWDAPDNIRGFSTLRYGGVSRQPYDGLHVSEGGLNLAMHVGDAESDVERNRDLLRQLLPKEPLWLSQVHGAKVVDAATTSGLPEADASFSVRRHDVCLIQTADCLPVLFCDQDGQMVAAAHAGWRGLAAGVLESTLLRMRQAGAKEILTWMGPAIGPAHFEVGKDVLEAFVMKEARLDRNFLPVVGSPGKYLADIYALARHILEKNQVSKISGGGFCTVSDARRFYSYRRDGVTGRMATCIWLE